VTERIDTLLCSLVLLVFLAAPVAFIGWLVWP